MPNVLVRDVPDEVHSALQRKAERRHQSLQQYLCAELQQLAARRSIDDVLDEVENQHGGGEIARSELRAAGDIAAPDLIDVETVSVLRKRWLRRTLTEQRFATALAHLQQLGFERAPTLQLMPRAFELRANVSAHDACYVALAELLDCDLVTIDGRLAKATGPRCSIRVLG
jgi:predicted nucleic acid-binding protein